MPMRQDWLRCMLPIMTRPFLPMACVMPSMWEEASWLRTTPSVLPSIAISTLLLSLMEATWTLRLSLWQRWETKMESMRQAVVSDTTCNWSLMVMSTRRTTWTITSRTILVLIPVALPIIVFLSWRLGHTSCSSVLGISRTIVRRQPWPSM